MNIRFKKPKIRYTEQALKLFLDSYEQERQINVCLPDKEIFSKKFENRLSELFQNGIGICAFNNENLIGYLIGYQVEDLFSQNKGIYIPLFGHGSFENSAIEIYQKMYKKAAEIWVEDNHLIHALTLFTYHRDLINTFFWLGFGLRCIDAIRKVALIGNNDNKNIKIKRMKLKEIKLLEGLYKKDNLYYGNSPLFMPVGQKINISELKDWFEKENRQLWIALIGDKPVGYIKIEPSGETIISEYIKMMNITGAFVDNKYRNKKIGQSLLNEVLIYLKENNYELCGVDFESFNIIGSNFWTKYFKPYTNSVVRKINF